MSSGNIPVVSTSQGFDDQNTGSTLVLRDSGGAIIVGAITATLLTLAGGAVFPVAAKSGDYTLTANDFLVTMSGAHTLTMPSAALHTGRIFVLFNLTATTCTLTTVTNSASMTAQYSCRIVQSDGSAWLAIASVGS